MSYSVLALKMAMVRPPCMKGGSVEMPSHAAGILGLEYRGGKLKWHNGKMHAQRSAVPPVAISLPWPLPAIGDEVGRLIGLGKMTVSVPRLRHRPTTQAGVILLCVHRASTQLALRVSKHQKIQWRTKTNANPATPTTRFTKRFKRLVN